MLQAIGRPDVPVLKGASRPQAREACHAPDVHGESGLGGVTLLPTPIASASQLSVGDLAAKLLAHPPNTVWMVATGPLTNVANLMDTEPRLASHLRGLSVMGGSIGGGFTGAPLGKKSRTGEDFGNITPYAEFNIYCDPEAAQKILSNEILASKTTLIPLDLTHLVRGNSEVLQHLFGPHHEVAQSLDRKEGLSIVRRLFREILNFFSDTYHALFDIGDGPPLHDPLAVWAALYPHHLYDSGADCTVKERWHVRVIKEGARYDADADPLNRLGQTVAEKASKGGIRIPRAVDKDEFWKAINQALKVAENKNAQ